MAGAGFAGRQSILAGQSVHPELTYPFTLDSVTGGADRGGRHTPLPAKGGYAILNLILTGGISL